LSEAGINLSKKKVSQTIDLNEIVGDDISLDEVLVKKIGQAIIDYNLDRAEEGLGIDRKPLKKYKKTYMNSDEFKSAGKSSTVNMRLSGDMLGALDIISIEGSKITYGIEDTDQAPKAYGHQTGYRGHPTIPEGKYKRRFFGLTKDEAEAVIFEKFSEELESRKVTKIGSTGRAIRNIRQARTLADIFDIDNEN